MQMTHNCFCLFYGLKPRCKHLCVCPTSLWEVNSPEAQSGLSCSSFQRRYVPCPILDLSINIHNFVVPATCMARNLGLTLDDLLSFAANSAVISHSCRLMGQGTRDQLPQPHGQVVNRRYIPLRAAALDGPSQGFTGIGGTCGRGEQSSGLETRRMEVDW